MNMSQACDVHRDTGYSNVCQVCGVPLDAGYFDVASIKKAPRNVGDEVEVARYELNSSVLRHIAVFHPICGRTEQQAASDSRITPGYEWLILCNNQPRAPYLPTA